MVVDCSCVHVARAEALIPTEAKTITTQSITLCASVKQNIIPKPNPMPLAASFVSCNSPPRSHQFSLAARTSPYRHAPARIRTVGRWYNSEEYYHSFGHPIPKKRVLSFISQCHNTFWSPRFLGSRPQKALHRLTSQNTWHNSESNTMPVSQ